VLNRLAKNKSLRLWFVGFFLFFMVWQPTPAYSAEAWAVVTCQDASGTSQEFTIGWNNENNYFLDKGNIPQHYCEGGFAGQFTTFVSVVSSDGTELDSALLYHPGYLAPDPVAPTPSPEPVPETQTTVRTDDVERTDEVATADVARTEEVVREPEPVAPVAPIEAPAPELTPEPTPEPTPTPTPEPEPSPTSPVKPVEPTKPPEVITPTPEPVVPSTSPTEPTIPSEPTPEPELPEETISIELALEAVGKLVDNLRSIGSDLSPEVREQAQQVVVASVIVTQVALAGRKP
jgi:outer membrane biosynthesis protein TonB